MSASYNHRRRHDPHRICGPEMSTNQPSENLPQCPACGTPMLLIGELPRVMDRPWVAVFRCKQCDAILTQGE